MKLKGEIKMTARLLVDVDEELKRKVKSKASYEGKTLRKIVEELLEKYLKE